MYREKACTVSWSHPLLHRVGLTFCQTVTLKPTNVSLPGLDTITAQSGLDGVRLD